MSKIIIHNESNLSDSGATQLVVNVMLKGFMSGEDQYCWVTTFDLSNVIQGELNYSVHAMKTRGKTHTFKVRNES